MSLRALSVAFFFTVTAIAAFAVEPPARLNVLFVAFDDLRIDLGCYGDKAAITPNLDRLAANGTLFTRAYCQQAVCNASRQSLLSGRTPDHIRVWDLATLFRQTRPDVVPLPEYFKRNGYFAQSFGKIYHGFKGMADPQSWSVPEQFEYVAKRDDYQLPENNGHEGENFKAAAVEFADAPDDAYPDGKVAAGAVAALEQYAKNPSQPFFLAVGIRKPHLPFTAPKRFWDMYDKVELPPLTQAAPPVKGPELALHNSPELRGYTDTPNSGPFDAATTARLRRGYYASASFADAQFGRVMAALEKTGLAKNTIVIIWGDHGYHLGEHGLWSKTTNYEADVRVPLIISTPDSRRRGVKTDSFVELMDMYPTLLELCGLPQDPALKLDGVSFAANIGDASKPGRPFAMSQFPRPWNGQGLEREFMGYTVRTPTHRYVEWRRFGTDNVVARELYAYHGEELFEKVNLADDPAQKDRVQQMAALLPKSPPATEGNQAPPAGAKKKKRAAAEKAEKP